MQFAMRILFSLNFQFSSSFHLSICQYLKGAYDIRRCALFKINLQKKKKNLFRLSTRYSPSTTLFLPQSIEHTSKSHKLLSMNATVTTMERKTIQLVDMRKVNNKLHIMSRTIVHSDQMGNGLYSKVV